MHVLIVNPFVSAEYLSSSFKKLGIKTTALYTFNDSLIDNYFKPKTEWFDQQIYLPTLDMPSLYKSISTLKINYVLNGSDSSVDITDNLAYFLTPDLANNPMTSKNRMDKYLMHKSLHSHGLSYIKQYKFNLLNYKPDDFKAINIQYPCLVKPLNSAGSYGVHKIDNYTHLIQFFSNLNAKEIFDKLKLYNNHTNAMYYLICEYVEGEEYFIDSFSYAGSHFISSVQKYYKKYKNGVPIYRYFEVVTDFAMSYKIINYIKKVLTCLGFNNGFAHSEVLIKSDGTPVLIEVNPRIGGALGLTNYLSSLNGLITQPELLSKILIKEFNDKPKLIYQAISSQARLLFLFHFSNSPVPNLTEKLKKYTSVKLIKQLKPVGYIHDYMPKSVWEAVAFVICHCQNYDELNSQSKDILKQDEIGW